MSTTGPPPPPAPLTVPQPPPAAVNVVTAATVVAPSGPAIVAPVPPPPTSSAGTPSTPSSGGGPTHLSKPESRESSEFEFLGGARVLPGGQHVPAPAPGQPSPPAATLPTERPATITTTPSAATAAGTAVPKSPSTPVPSPSAGPPDAGGGGIFGRLLYKVAEKTKNSVETMITTLDPQMKEYIYSGGDIEIVVTSEAESKVLPLRSAFQTVFGRATVVGMKAHPAVAIAEQPVGYAAGRQGALERIQNFRSKNTVPGDVVLVAVEGFLLEVGEDSWVELSCLALSDPARKIQLTTYSQATPVDASFVQAAKAATPDSYPRRWSGFAETVGSVIAKSWNVPPQNWHEAVCGVERAETIELASKTLAGLYQKALWTHAHHQQGT